MTTTPLQDYLDKVRALIRKHGYAVQAVLDNPAYAYTVGVSAPRPVGSIQVQGLDQPGEAPANDVIRLPELVVVGLAPETGQRLLNDVVRRVLDGSLALQTGTNHDNIFQGLPARFARLLSDSAARHLKVARALNEPGWPVAAWQLLWPDSTGKFPGEAGVDPGTEAIQNLDLALTDPAGPTH